MEFDSNPSFPNFISVTFDGLLTALHFSLMCKMGRIRLPEGRWHGLILLPRAEQASAQDLEWMHRESIYLTVMPTIVGWSSRLCTVICEMGTAIATPASQFIEGSLTMCVKRPVLEELAWASHPNSSLISAPYLSIRAFSSVVFSYHNFCITQEI